MNKVELLSLKEYCQEKDLLNVESIKSFIETLSPNKYKLNYRFLINDLVKKNIIYKLNKENYKFNNSLVSFKYKENNIEITLKNIISSNFSNIKFIIWDTSFLSNFMNLLPYFSYTIIEVEGIFLDYIFDLLKIDFPNILINPDKKELNYYKKDSGNIILRKLPINSPINESIKHIGRYSKLTNDADYSITIEKIIVDIFIDQKKLLIYSELETIYINLLKIYCVNFQKLFRYAKYRGIYDELKYFFKNITNYNYERGEFYD